MEFVALDVETANRTPSSICAIAVARQNDSTWTWSVRPEPFLFEQLHQRLHGVTAASVEKAPSFAEVWPEVVPFLQGRVLVAHNAGFDTTAILSACKVSNLQIPDCRVLCSLQLARRIWPESPSHSLDSLALHLGIPLVHHDAASDANAAFSIIERAIAKCSASGIEALIADHSFRCEPLSPGSNLDTHASHETFRLHSSDLQGMRVAITGSMLALTRSDAEQLVSEYGGTNTNSVSSKLDFLVLGGGGGAGAKLGKARGLVESGAHLRILTEDQFLKAFEFEDKEIVTRALRTLGEDSHGGSHFSFDVADFVTFQLSNDPALAELLATEEARMAAFSPEERKAFDAKVEQLEADERSLIDELNLIHSAANEHHARIQHDRQTGIVGSQTEIGKGYGLSARKVGKILDTHGLRERIDVDIAGVPEHLQRHGGIYPPMFGTKYMKVEGGPIHHLRGVVDGFAVHDSFDGRDYWIASSVAPLLAPFSKKRK